MSLTCRLEQLPDATLAAVAGASALPRTELTKKIWDYIKRNGLQDQQNRRMINADDKLRAVFGGEPQVNMFRMTSLVNQHVMRQPGTSARDITPAAPPPRARIGLKEFPSAPTARRAPGGHGSIPLAGVDGDREDRSLR